MDRTGRAVVPASRDSWQLPAAEVLRRLDATTHGLAASVAADRLRVHGRNSIDEKPRRRLLLDFLSRFRNPLVLILVAAAAVSAATGDQPSFFIIVAIVVLSVALDFVQERRALIETDRLKQQVALTVSVLRDGGAQTLPAALLVPGDVILLAAGDLVPADCRLLEARDLFVNEALLTGESFPAEKHAGDEAGPAAAAATPVPANGLFLGSSVIGGSARALVVATGRGTMLGGVAHTLRREPPPTAFMLALRDFGAMIARLTLLLVLVALLFNLALHRPLIESFLFALALAVGLTPELLPMVVSVTLAHGARRMARQQVIVKRLSAIFDLGSMDVLCSDKTGTLTESRIALVRYLDESGADCPRVLELGYLNAAFETGLKSPIDEAIVACRPVDAGLWRKIDEVPFDFNRRRISVLVERDGARTLIVKGAPEDILRLSTTYRPAGADAPMPFDEAARARAARTFDRLSNDGLRLVGVAARQVDPAHDNAVVTDESELTFVGFLAFLDPPKESAQAAVADLALLGIAVKIVTGDNEQVTAHVCRRLGIAIEGVLTGPELDGLSDEALYARLHRTNLFCRMVPAQKARIIRALRRMGHTVGYLGDGINDAPSLASADVGISVDGAADVAKEAAAMILLRHDLAPVAEGVREGRRTFANILKYVLMGTSSNFGNMFSMAGGALFLPFLPMTPVQILLNNLLYDLSEAAIPMDRVDARMIERPRRWDIGLIRRFMIVLGGVSSIFDFLTFGLLLWVFQAGEQAFHTGWFVESLATQALAVLVIRVRGAAWKSRPHPLLLWSSAGVAALAFALPYTPAASWLGFVPLPPAMAGTLVALTAAYLVTVELVKRWSFDGWRGPR